MDERSKRRLAELLSADPAYADHEKRDRILREIMIAYGGSVAPIGLEKDIKQAGANRRKSSAK